jgi:hypothetical protein
MCKEKRALRARFRDVHKPFGMTMPNGLSVCAKLAISALDAADRCQHRSALGAFTVTT